MKGQDARTHLPSDATRSDFFEEIGEGYASNERYKKGDRLVYCARISHHKMNLCHLHPT